MHFWHQQRSRHAQAPQPDCHQRHNRSKATQTRGLQGFSDLRGRPASGPANWRVVSDPARLHRLRRTHLWSADHRLLEMWSSQEKRMYLLSSYPLLVSHFYLFSVLFSITFIDTQLFILHFDIFLRCFHALYFLFVKVKFDKMCALYLWEVQILHRHRKFSERTGT